jgi:hypothetical protein
MAQKVLLGLAVVIAATGGAVSQDASARGSPPSAAMTAQDCTVTQKLKRVQALRTYKARMRSARRAYFLNHRSAQARRLFVKRQQVTLRKLKRLAACTVPPSIPPPPD